MKKVCWNEWASIIVYAVFFISLKAAAAAAEKKMFTMKIATTEFITVLYRLLVQRNNEKFNVTEYALFLSKWIKKWQTSTEYTTIFSKNTEKKTLRIYHAGANKKFHIIGLILLTLRTESHTPQPREKN